MKKKIFSVLGILILSINTVFCNAVEISFEVLDSQDGEFYIDDEESQEYFTTSEKASDEILQNAGNFSEDENILEDEENIFIFNDTNFQESSLEAENIYIDNNFYQEEVELEHAISTFNINRINLPTITNYMTFSKTNSVFVDVTNLATGEAVSHDCNLYLAKNFNENEHWNECTICGNKFYVTSHNLSSYWTLGNTCNPNNKLRSICDCGYFTESENTRSHGTMSTYANQGYCAKRCSVCYAYVVQYGTTHYNSSNNPIGCGYGRTGTCKYCGYYASATHGANCSFYNNGDSNVTNCFGCDKQMFDLNLSSCTYTQNGKNFTVSMTIYLLETVTRVVNPAFSLSSKGVLTSSSSSKSGHYAYFNFSGYYYDDLEDVINISCPVYTSTSGQNTYFAIYTDIEAPQITEIMENNINEKDGWVTAKELTIKGTENYCKSVTISMEDEESNVYLNKVATNVINNQWEYTFTPDIESNENTKFIITVTDTHGNVLTKDDVTYSKLDKKAPTITTGEKETTQEWSKTKDYTISCIDKGVGEVSVAFNSLEELYPADMEGDNFYKNFTFIGDVYGKTTGAIYYQDGLGNTSTSFVNIYNLDNTAPSVEGIIMNKSLYNTEITILANDINEKLNATGSGVTGYAISKKNEIPATFQEENTFNISESGKYYLFITDLVGNVAFRELNIPVQYKVTINPDGGTWKGDSNPKEYIADNEDSINLYPEPEKDGYTFKEWKITGDGEITENGELIIEGDVEVTPIWEANKYEVTFIDYDVTHNRTMNTTIREIDFSSEISGSYIGSDILDNAYYKQYRLISDTSVIISTNPENNVVYRYFEFCYTEMKSHIDFNDKENQDGLRPDTYKLQLVLEDGTIIDEVTLPTSQPDYTFENLPKYDEQGEEYNYKIIPIISDRYTSTEPDEEGNTTIIYNNPACSINIPKTATLDGKNGDLTYTIQVEANLFYKDKIIIIPEEKVTLTDGISNMQATITQNKTEFIKDDELKITGQIQTNRKHFAGVWYGTFNFKIKYEVSN